MKKIFFMSKKAFSMKENFFPTLKNFSEANLDCPSCLCAFLYKRKRGEGKKKDTQLYIYIFFFEKIIRSIVKEENFHSLPLRFTNQKN